MGHEDESGTSFSVSGGAGRVEYTLAEIEATGRGIGMVGRDVLDASALLSKELKLLVDFPGGLFSPGMPDATGAQYAALSAEATLAGAQTSVAAAAHGVEDLSRHALAAVERYEAAEAAAAASEKTRRAQTYLDGLQVSTAGIFAPLLLWHQLRQLRDRAGRDGLRDTAEERLNNAPAYTAGLLGPMVGLGYLLERQRTGGDLARSSADGGRATAGKWEALMVRKFFDWSGLAQPGHLEMRPVPAGEWNGQPESWRPGHAVPDPPGGADVEVSPCISGLLAGSQDAYGYPPGSIAVDRVDRPDGTRAWIVHLPGTEDWSKIDSTNPMDLEGDLEAITASQQALFGQEQIVVQEMMRQALTDAGALPSQDVMITGHSGGGIHAAAAAANPAFLSDFNVKMIIIAGAPARNQAVDPGVTVVDLSNDDDLVTAVDYGPPPATANWVSVTSHRPGVTAGRSTIETAAQAHDLGNYLDDANALELSNDPGVVAARATVATFLAGARARAGAGATVTVARRVYQGRDVNDPKTNPKSRQKSAPNKDRRQAGR